MATVGSSMDPVQNNSSSAAGGAAAPTAAAGAGTSSKNLLQQLPAGAVLAFQALAATFTNQGHCFPSNRWLSVGLVTFLSATCIFFSFTDTVRDSTTGKLHKGVALPGRLHIVNLSRKDQKSMSSELKKRGLKTVDWVHATLSLVVFLTIAGSDVGLQDCFFPFATDDTRQLLRNLPLGMAVMSSFLFMIFPTTRKGIKFDSGVTSDIAADSKVTDKVLSSSANLLQLLPTGPVLAFQTLSASFTNQGKCYHSNLLLTAGLVTFLSATCIFCSFTDSAKDRHGKVHKGVALPGRLRIINLSRKEEAQLFKPSSILRERRLKTLDWVHALFSAVVFLTIAGSDVGLQNCFFPKANDDTKQLLKNLPLGMAVMSSFVFIIFPTTRNGITFDDSDYTVIQTTPSADTSGPGDEEDQSSTRAAAAQPSQS